VAQVVTGAYRDLFAATTGAAGALTGLLFVAMSVASERALVRGPHVIRQMRASAALLSFTSALAVSLYGLVPGTNIGYPAVVVAVIGIFFTAAAIRSVLASRSGPSLVRSQVSLVMLLLAISFTELIAGIVVLGSPASNTSVQVIGYAVVTSLLVGIGRAWEFIGERDTGILASMGILVGHADPRSSADTDDSWSEDSASADSQTADRRADRAKRSDAPAERDGPPAGDA
jgi:hypothetical protein